MEANYKEIPPVTDPLGRYWEQPSRDRIIIDDVHAVMDQATLEALHNYSSSTPTGVYEGKMWRRFFRQDWYLAWYGPSDELGRCSINWRKILLC